jgi:hypothetical protein
MKLVLIICFLISSCSLFQPSRYKIEGCYKSQSSIVVTEEGEEMFKCEKTGINSTSQKNIR